MLDKRSTSALTPKSTLLVKGFKSPLQLLQLRGCCLHTFSQAASIAHEHSVQRLEQMGRAAMLQKEKEKHSVQLAPLSQAWFKHICEKKMPVKSTDK